MPIALAGEFRLIWTPHVAEADLDIRFTGSRLCVETVCEDLGVPLPATYTAAPKVATNALDRKEGFRLRYFMEDNVILLIVLAVLAVAMNASFFKLV